MEAALQLYYGVDLRDLWRPGRALTWRRLLVLIEGLPSHWTIEAHLLDDIRRHLAASPKNRKPKPSPGRFVNRRRPDDSVEAKRRKSDARRRARERRRAIEAGEIH